ncbi:MAG TPA: hypothetical protein VGK99_13420 [Acidobacteriota bacterium]|jgi:hypothetical protein
MKALALLFSIFYLPLQAQEFQLVFAPPNGLEYTEKLKASVIRDMGNGMTNEDTAETTTEVKVTKTSAGYDIQRTQTAIRTMRNARPFENPMNKILLGRKLTYQISPAGEFQALKGAETIGEEIQKTLPPQLQSLASAMSPEALKNREQGEWNSRIGELIGLRFKSGEQKETVQEYPFQTGPIKYTTIMRFSEVRKDGEKNLVTIAFRYDSDAAALKSSENGTQAAGSAVATSDKPVIRGEGERVIDLNTMTIQSEKTRQEIMTPIDVPGRGKFFPKRLETREYSYQFKPAP